MEGARSFDAGPAQLVLTASVARRYYVDGRSKVDIAEEFSLSRFKVARLLEQARTSGLVRIEIGYAGDIDVDLSGRLQRGLGLRHALVVDTPEDDEAALRKQLGKAAADLLAEIVTADDVLGLAWARAVTAMTASLRTAPCRVRGPADRRALPSRRRRQLDRAGARGGPRFGGVAYLFYAPLIVPDAATAAALRGQPEIARAFGQFRTSPRPSWASARGRPGRARCTTRWETDERARAARPGRRRRHLGRLRRRRLGRRSRPGSPTA